MQICLCLARRFVQGFAEIDARDDSDGVMTINDLRCDVCGRMLTGLGGSTAGPAAPATGSPRSGIRAGVRFVYHPGRPELRDASGLACTPCWEEAVRSFSHPVIGQCAACGTGVTRLGSLHLRCYDNPQAWRLCPPHAVEFLNRLRTVEPKLDPATFRFPFG